LDNQRDPEGDSRAFSVALALARPKKAASVDRHHYPLKLDYLELWFAGLAVGEGGGWWSDVQKHGANTRPRLRTNERKKR